MIGVYAERARLLFICAAIELNALRITSTRDRVDAHAVVSSRPVAFRRRACPCHHECPDGERPCQPGGIEHGAPGSSTIAGRSSRRPPARWCGRGRWSRGVPREEHGLAPELAPARRRPLAASVVGAAVVAAGERGHAEVDDLDALARVRVAVALQWCASKAGGELETSPSVGGSHGHVERVLLAAVAQVGARVATHARRHAVRRAAARLARVAQLAGDGPQVVRLDRLQVAEERADAVVADRRLQHPPGRQHPRARRARRRAAISSSSASATACSGPAPPKASRSKSRGSMPRATVTSRMAFGHQRVRRRRRSLGQLERVQPELGRDRSRRRPWRRRGRARSCPPSSAGLRDAARAAGWRRSRSAACRRGRSRPVRGPRPPTRGRRAGRPTRRRRCCRRRRRAM